MVMYSLYLRKIYENMFANFTVEFNELVKEG